MYCPKCGAEVPEGNRFCENCGAKMPERTQPQPQPQYQAQPQQQYQLQQPQQQYQAQQPQQQYYAQQPQGQYQQSAPEQISGNSKKSGGGNVKFIFIGIAVVAVIAVIIFFIFGRGNGKLEGTYTATIDVGKIFNEEINDELSDLDIKADLGYKIILCLTLEDDSTWTLKYDAEKDAKATTEFFDDLADFMIDAMYAEAEAEGMDKNAMDFLIRMSYGKSLEDYVKDDMAVMIDYDEVLGELEDFEASGIYEADNGKIRFASDKDSVNGSEWDTYSGKVISVNRESVLFDNGEMSEIVDMGIPFPVEFKK